MAAGDCRALDVEPGDIDVEPIGWVKRLETSTHWPRIAGPVGLAGDRGPWAALFNYLTRAGLKSPNVS